MNHVAAFAAQFATRFGAAPTLAWAPGRVNLIGDHVDYCGGTVLPMPIQFGTTVGVRLTDDARIRGASSNASLHIDVPLGGDCPLPVGSWGRFLWGAIAVLAEEGVEIGGADVLVGGDIPGSGLSSSASLTVALLSALTAAAARAMAPLQIALAAQRVEHEYVGVQCGLMDQAVIALAEPGTALLFDCYDHRHRSIAVDDPAVRVVVADTGCARQLVHSAYNARLRETRAAAAALAIPHDALARLDPRVFRDRQRVIDDAVCERRARHVVSEAARVARAATSLESRDWSKLGRLLGESHASLRDDFEVSCAELDVLADALSAQAGCYGARMTGAGFGGSVVALIESAAVDGVMADASTRYANRFGNAPNWFVARSLGGVRLLDG
jgi:galactokinase